MRPGRASLPRSLALGAALTLGVAASPSPGDGQRAYDRGDFAEALRLWLPRAEGGNPEVQVAIGDLYDTGRGVPQDAASAYQWYSRAARNGSAEAELNVAIMLDSGRGVAADAAQSALWYARAAARGNHRAQYNLASLYVSGSGVPRNLAAAEALYGAAAFGGLAAAASRVHAGEPPLPALGTGDTPLTPAVPVAPAGAVSAENATELVWLAPEQPVRVQYFVEIVEIADRNWRPVFRATVETPLARATFPAEPRATYAWRVYTTARDTSHYAASPWTTFRIETPG